MRIHPTLLLGLFPLILLACGPGEHAFHGNPYQNPSTAPDIQAEDFRGVPFGLSEKKGTTILLYFGYTFCPDICPATLADIHWVFKQFDASELNAELVFITVDPERDTPEALETYLARFHPAFTGLNLSDSNLFEIKQLYGVFSEKEPSEKNDYYLVSHTSRVFLIDPDGLLVTNYSFGTSREDILIDLKYLHDQ
jgi:protein SCO1/2